MQRLKPSTAPMWECPAAEQRQHTADCGQFLWVHFGPWSGKHPAQLADFLRKATVERLQTDADDLQLMLASGTADKLQQVLVGYVSRPEGVR